MSSPGGRIHPIRDLAFSTFVVQTVALPRHLRAAHAISLTHPRKHRRNFDLSRGLPARSPTREPCTPPPRNVLPCRTYRTHPLNTHLTPPPPPTPPTPTRAPTRAPPRPLPPPPTPSRRLSAMPPWALPLTPLPLRPPSLRSRQLPRPAFRPSTPSSSAPLHLRTRQLPRLTFRLSPFRPSPAAHATSSPPACPPPAPAACPPFHTSPLPTTHTNRPPCPHARSPPTALPATRPPTAAHPAPTTRGRSTTAAVLGPATPYMPPSPKPSLPIRTTRHAPGGGRHPAARRRGPWRVDGGSGA